MRSPASPSRGSTAFQVHPPIKNPSVLNDIDAVARGDRRRRPNAWHLLGPGHILLETRFGDFDCLGAIDGSRSYEDLLEASVALDLDGRSLRVIGLGELLRKPNEHWIFSSGAPGQENFRTAVSARDATPQIHSENARSRSSSGYARPHSKEAG